MVGNNIGQAALKQMDTNNDGVVDAAEFAAAGGSKQEFDKYDLNGDGVLDADEMALRAADKLQSPIAPGSVGSYKHSPVGFATRSQMAKSPGMSPACPTVSFATARLFYFDLCRGCCC